MKRRQVLRRLAACPQRFAGIRDGRHVDGLPQKSLSDLCGRNIQLLRRFASQDFLLPIDCSCLAIILLALLTILLFALRAKLAILLFALITRLPVLLFALCTYLAILLGAGDERHHHEN